MRRTGRSGAGRIVTARWPSSPSRRRGLAALTKRWQVEVGPGYATPVIVGDRVFMFSRQGEDEVLTAFDAGTG